MRWLILAGLMSCETYNVAWASRARAPDGSWMFVVRCREDIGRCYTYAGDICPGGYRVFDRDQQTWVDTSGHFVRGTGRISSETSYQGVLLISYDRTRCPGL